MAVLEEMALVLDANQRPSNERSAQPNNGMQPTRKKPRAADAGRSVARLQNRQCG